MTRRAIPTHAPRRPRCRARAPPRQRSDRARSHGGHPMDLVLLLLAAALGIAIAAVLRQLTGR